MGSPTSLLWEFVYTHPNSLINIVAPELSGVPVHPTQVYEIAYFLALAGILLGLRQYLQPMEGMSFLTFLVGHSIERFLIMFFRGDYSELQVVAWLTQAQIIALAVFFISVPWLVAYYVKVKRKNKISSSL